MKMNERKKEKKEITFIKLFIYFIPSGNDKVVLISITINIILLFLEGLMFVLFLINLHSLLEWRKKSSDRKVFFSFYLFFVSSKKFCAKNSQKISFCVSLDEWKMSIFSVYITTSAYILLKLYFTCRI